jgi:TAT (twin-arginine translocation) pathway signal sequence
MSVSRRNVLKGAATISAAASLPAFAASGAQTLVLFDSRIAESRSFAMGRHPKLDIAILDMSRWAELRGGLSGIGQVTGLTGWSDWIVARGLLEEHGLRLQSEAAVPAPISGKAHLFRWEMR